MNISPIAMDVLLDMRSERKHWRSYEWKPGQSLIIRDLCLLEDLDIADADPKGTVRVEQHYVTTDQVTDMLTLISITVALTKQGLLSEEPLAAQQAPEVSTEEIPKV